MKASITICLSILIVLFTNSVLAHGGVEKSVDNITVFLNQTPLSPLVGENVTMAFSFQKHDKTLQPLKKLPVKLTLTDTYMGDESKDVVVLTKDLVTDDNGDLEFSYTFDKDNYFDVDLNFKDPTTQKDEEVGFLVQIRKPIPTLASILDMLLNLIKSKIHFDFNFNK